MQNGLAEMDAKAKSQPAEAQAALQQQYAEGREMIAKLDSARERLKSYLVPRMMQLDPIATSLAMKRGEADWRDVNAMMQRCPAKCTPLPKQQVEACLNECNDKDLWNRVRACMNPNWLPF
ncbi:MAG TPA: hypothetical protein VMT66_12205 [Steroidobacteraceae bacterium]|nr:hypothetical protein [Steroidobacteraceae bacterium]